MRLQLKGRKWAWRAQGLPGVTALEALHRPFLGTGLFGNARVIGSSHATKINHAAILLFFAQYLHVFHALPNCLAANP